MVARSQSPSRPAAQSTAGADTALAAAGPQKRSRMSRAFASCASNAMLAVGASVAGRQLPVWNIDVPVGVRLRQVLTGWAVAVLQLREQGLPPSARVAGGPGRPLLDLDATLLSLKPQLPVRGGRLCITVSVPGLEPQEQAAKKAAAKNPSVKASLGRLRISSRYTGVDRGAMGYHQSSTFKDKVQSGFYGAVGASGVELPRGHGQAMRACPSSGLCGGEAVWPGPVESRELVVYGRGAAAGAAELFRVRLVGPESQLANWAAAVQRFEKHGAGEPPDARLRALPFPVFVPSRGRAARAHLNWEAPHVFGPPGASTPGARPVLCFVVEPQEEAEYREHWPRALMMVLPKGGRGPSYARWVVQLACSRAYEWRADVRRSGGGGVCGPPRRLPWCWICDDNLLCFFRLVGTPRADGGRTAVCKRREWEAETPLFWEAMVAVQEHPALMRAAVAGFLRDDGTATCKKRDWKADELSLYKVVLLNNRELQRLGAEYLPGLRLFEDIYLNTEVRRLGGHSLKCQAYCFRAAQFGQGGCAEQRERGRKRTAEAPGLGGLIDARALAALRPERQAAVRQLAQWVQHRERQSRTKQQCQGEAPASPARRLRRRGGAPGAAAPAGGAGGGGEGGCGAGGSASASGSDSDSESSSSGSSGGCSGSGIDDA